MKTSATKETVQKALENVNKKRGYKLEFKRADQSGKWFNFTIRSEKSGIPGARVSHSGRNLPSASWHAHGYLFEEILKLDPEAVIKSHSATIDKSGGNWQDYNCGSFYRPVMMSETSIL